MRSLGESTANRQLPVPETASCKSRADGQQAEYGPARGTPRQPQSGHNNLWSLINSTLSGMPRTTETPWVGALGWKIRIEGHFVAIFQVAVHFSGQSCTCWIWAGEHSRLITQMGGFAQKKARAWFEGVTCAAIRLGGRWLSLS